MTVDEFAGVTQRVIAANGFAEFQPTACFPTRQSIRSLAGFPPHQDPELPVLKWASGIAKSGEEFLVAFKISATHFKVIRQLGASRESETYIVAQQVVQADGPAFGGPAA